MADTSPEQIGWLFVKEYYSKLSDNPEKLYQFYNKASTVIHGQENEAITPARGQAEVQARVQEQKFENCRVLVSNLDCLASLDGGVVVQVLGELEISNSCRKFAQTFFLAQQPKGYYVLNDILRFIKDEDGEDEEEEKWTAQAKTDFGPIGTEQKDTEPKTTTAEAPALPTPAVPLGSAAPQTPHVPIPTIKPATTSQIEPEVATKKPTKADANAKTTAPTPTTAAPAHAAATGHEKPTATANNSENSGAKPSQKSQDKKEKKIYYSAYLKNVVPGVEKAPLLAGLEKAGQVTHLQLETEKGRAFVDFVDQQTLDRALALQSIRVGSVTVVIEPRKRRKPVK